MSAHDAVASPRVYPSKAVDMTGQRLGRLVVVRRGGRTDHGHAIWECQCDCGALHRTSRRNLLHPKSATRSCGCLHAERSRARLLAKSAARRDAGASVARPSGTGEVSP